MLRYATLFFILALLFSNCNKKNDRVTLEQLNTVHAQIASCSVHSDCTWSGALCGCQPLAHNKQADINEYLILQKQYLEQNPTPCPMCAETQYSSECVAGKCEAVSTASPQ